MRDKKLTPIQEAIQSLTEDSKKVYGDGDYYNGIDRGYQNAIDKLQSLLPTEKEFAREFFNDGNNLGGLVKFEDSFKQYEP